MSLFVLTKALARVLDPPNLLLAAFVAGTALLWTRWRAAGRTLLGVATAVGVAITVLPVADWLAVPLEVRFEHPASMPDRADGIIVLGGAFDLGNTEAEGPVEMTRRADRMVAFVALARRYPEAKLVFTGGSGRAFGAADHITEAAAARLFLDQIGFPAERVLFEERSRDTYENALNAQALVRPAPGERWVLITSALHMPRAVACFRGVGWDVLPYPVDYRTPGAIRLAPHFRFLAALDGISEAAHEWAGLVVYRLLGRTRELFPAPNA